MRVLCRAVALGIAIVATMAPAANAARTTDFDADWRFALVNREAATDPTGAFDGAAEPGFDDSSWRALDLPHDWSIELLPTPTGGTTAGTGFFQGGLGWYRKTFTLPRSARGKRISVEFDGVYMDSEVYFNGRRVGSHPYGYTGFAVELIRRPHRRPHPERARRARCATRSRARAGIPAAASTGTCTSWSRTASTSRATACS